MNSWTIYWILQLDSINSALFVIALVLSLLSAACLLFGAIEKGRSQTFPESELSKGEWRRGVALHEVCKRTGIPALALFLVIGFLPSTKTAAAMVIVPAIVNNETLQREADDLYQLAKQALRDAVGSDEKTPAK